MDCCSNKNDSNNEMTNQCPDCGRTGEPVRLKTVKNLFKNSLFEITGVNYNFCSTPSCSVVYYDNNSHHKILESDLKEKVYQKHTDDKSVKLCYCFNYTLDDIVKDINENGRSVIYDKIVEGTKSGICACDLKNPEGKCCLANIKILLQNHV